MMATAGPPGASGLLPLLETLEDGAAGQAEQTDAYLTIASRISGDEGRQFLPAVEKNFALLGNSILGHISSSSPELSQAALQALGFCVYHAHVASRLSESFTAEILAALCSLVTKSTDKNTCTRALWVISKQSFPADAVAKQVPTILASVECVWVRDDVQSVIMEHEALNVIIRLLEQVPTPMADGAVRWARLVVPLVVHSASKVRLRAAAALELGMPLLLQKQAEVAAVIEPMMSTKLIPELQKLFTSKNEANVLKLWPLFIKLLGKLLHRGGPFINSLLHLEELGFRSPSASVKKIAFIAWKSLIDNFALNPDILCSAKRMKLLMQPLASIHVRTEALLLTKVEVWWYLVVQLGPNLPPHFDLVSVPLLQCSFGFDSASAPVTPSRSSVTNGAAAPGTPKSGFGSPGNLSWISSTPQPPSSFPSIQLLGLEMLLHYFLGPEAAATAAKSKLSLSLEPLSYPLLSGASSFSKHATVLISSVRDGFSSVGKEASESLLTVIWTSLVRFVSLTIESGGSKKERQGCEALTMTLQALQAIVASERLPADKVMALLEATVKPLPSKVLGSASYQVGKMDVLNGTPALFLILLLYDSSLLPSFVLHDRFFHLLQTLVGCGLSGPASPLAFAEAVLAAASRSAPQLHSKEVQWRMWSAVVGPLTDTITQTNEVNQGDALEHNFGAVHAALMFPVTQLVQGAPLPQASQKATLASWSKLYRVFARCSALVVTAEENICCEELSAKMAAAIDGEALSVPSTASAVACMLQVMAECVDFSPYTPHFQQKLKSPRTPVGWMRKKSRALGNLSSFLSLLLRCLHVYLDASEASCDAAAPPLLAVLSALFSNLALADAVREALARLVPPLARLYGKAAGGPGGDAGDIQAKLEKLLPEVLGCLQTRAALAYDSVLLALLSPLLAAAFPHRNKQIRAGAAQFWNATFANSVGLSYPDELRPVLLQVKQNTPIILPGFQVSGVPPEPGLLDSSDGSQLETKLSGFAVAPLAVRDCRVSLTPQKNHQTPKPVSTKLDFGSPPRRDVLEEEATVDFVFIPPEAKQRVLTEHQKEVKRTKRVDIPAMYNNLDASLDATAFSQDTQSQDDSLDKPATGRGDAGEQVSQKEVEVHDVRDVRPGETKDRLDEDTATPERLKQPVVVDSAGVPVQEDTGSDETTPQESRENTSPNVSASSDVVSDTPQKLNSRRQSFITLEKYPEGKSSSLSSRSSFTGPLMKICKTPKRSSKASPSEALSENLLPNSQSTQHSAHELPESPRRPKESLGKAEPVKLTERLSSGGGGEDEDVIPDTQTDDPTESLNATAVASSQDEDSALEDSQSSVTESSSDARPPECPRVRPLLPGDDPAEPAAKFPQFKKRRSQEEPRIDSVQSRRNTRSQQAAEEMSRTIRTRSKGDEWRSGQSNSQGKTRKRIKLFSSSEDFLGNPERKRRSSSGFESSQTESDNQASKRRVRQNKSAKQTENDPDEPRKDPQAADNLGQVSSPLTSESSGGTSSTNETSSRDAQTEQSPDETQSQEDSNLLTQSSESQSQRRSRRGKTTPEATENLSKDSPKRQTRSNSQPEVQSAGRSTRRNSAPASRAGPECSVLLKKKERRPRASLQNPTVSKETNEDTADASQNTQNLEAEILPTPGDVPDLEVLQGPHSAEEEAKAAPETGSLNEDDSKTLNDQSVVEAEKRDLTTGGERSSQGGSESAAPREQETPNPTPEDRPAAVGSVPPHEDHPAESDSVPPPEDRPAESDSVPPPEDHPAESDSVPPPEDRPAAEGSVPLPEDRPAAVDSVPLPEDRPAAVDSVPLPEDRPAVDSVLAPEDCPAAADSVPPLEDLPTAADSVPPLEDLPTAADSVPPLEDLPTAADSVPPPEDTPETTAAEVEAETDRGEEAADVSGKEAGSDKTGVQEKEGHLSSVPPEEEVLSGPEDHQESLENPTSSINEDPGSKSHTAPGSMCRRNLQGSPLKLQDQEAGPVWELGQSPSGGRTRGTWSPSASPSTSILKKNQKRQLEADSPSPLIKSRRVSFANPIQRQETADDIDRRSPAVRTSSPRRPKLVTTPTKGLLSLSPRTLHSPGTRSSKKCLISEMSLEPRPVSRHCVYPPLVGCSAPVEAVLPQISSNMWSRGFGQLVRARNIRTVGDLSALTPGEVKSLPIRSPKVSNVKKALQAYEQQRKGRGGGDELKSFDETERMTSEAEETSAPHAADEDDKTSIETLATELLDEGGAEPQEEAGPEAGLLSELRALSRRAGPAELSRCSPRELVDAHQLLGGLMRSVVVELEARIGHAEG